MDKKFNVIMRTGKTIDMFSEIEDLQAKYLSDLRASVDAFETYGEVSEETFNDLNSLRGTLSLFVMLGYLFDEEYEEMIKEAEIQRKNILKELEGTHDDR